MATSEMHSAEVDISPVVNALIAIFGVLTARLEQQKVFQKGEFGAILVEASKRLPTIDGAPPNMDVAMTIVRAVGETLSIDPAPAPTSPFSLTVIKGGRSED